MGADEIRIGGRSFRLRPPPRTVVEIGEPMKLEYHFEPAPPEPANVLAIEAIVSLVWQDPETTEVVVCFAARELVGVLELRMTLEAFEANPYLPGQSETLTIGVRS